MNALILRFNLNSCFESYEKCLPSLATLSYTNNAVTKLAKLARVGLQTKTVFFHDYAKLFSPRR